MPTKKFTTPDLALDCFLEDRLNEESKLENHNSTIYLCDLKQPNSKTQCRIFWRRSGGRTSVRSFDAPQKGRNVHREENDGERQ